MNLPKIIILAGPNGAGKTTFAREFLPEEAGCPVFLNADLIAAGLSPFAPERASIQAGRLMLQSIDQHVAKLECFAFETTLSGLGYAKKIPQWRDRGYRVELVFLRLPSADAAMQRVAERVRQGGHDIPEPVIRRRFESGNRLLVSVYQTLVDKWTVYDNSGARPVMVDSSDRVSLRNLIREPDPEYGASGAPEAPQPDAYQQGVLAALERAAARARKVAQQTGTALIIFRDGQVVRLDPWEAPDDAR